MYVYNLYKFPITPLEFLSFCAKATVQIPSSRLVSIQKNVSFLTL